MSRDVTDWAEEIRAIFHGHRFVQARDYGSHSALLRARIRASSNPGLAGDKADQAIKSELDQFQITASSTYESVLATLEVIHVFHPANGWEKVFWMLDKRISFLKLLQQERQVDLHKKGLLVAATYFTAAPLDEVKQLAFKQYLRLLRHHLVEGPYVEKAEMALVLLLHAEALDVNSAEVTELFRKGLISLDELEDAVRSVLSDPMLSQSLVVFGGHARDAAEYSILGEGLETPADQEEVPEIHEDDIRTNLEQILKLSASSDKIVRAATDEHWSVNT